MTTTPHEKDINWILLDNIGFYRILLDSFGYYRILLDIIGFHWISSDSIGRSNGRPNDVPIGLPNMSLVKKVIHLVVLLQSETGQVLGLYMI